VTQKTEAVFIVKWKRGLQKRVSPPLKEDKKKTTERKDSLKGGGRADVHLHMTGPGKQKSINWGENMKKGRMKKFMKRPDIPFR